MNTPSPELIKKMQDDHAKSVLDDLEKGSFNFDRADHAVMADLALAMLYTHRQLQDLIRQLHDFQVGRVR